MSAILPQNTIDILDIIFGDDVNNAVVGSYSEVPMTYWNVDRVGTLLEKGFTNLASVNDNYTCVGTYEQNSPRAKRLGNTCRGIYLVVLDDIGSKYNAPIGWGPPSYRLQTSVSEAGVVNEQWGYFLDKPIKDIAFAKTFLKTVVGGSAASDKIGDLSRFIRLPGSNNKPSYSGLQIVQYTSWDPEFRYSVETILGWVGKTVEELQRYEIAPTMVTVDVANHPIVEAFNTANLLLEDAPNDKGWLGVVCPWEDKHSTVTGTKTGLIIREDGSWHVHCFHSSCKPDNTGKLNNEDVISQLRALNGVVAETHEIDCANWAAIKSLEEIRDKDIRKKPSEVLPIEKRYAFIMTENLYWDMHLKLPIKRDALDHQWSHVYTGSRTRPLITRVLSRNFNKIMASGIGFHTIDSDIFEYEGNSYVNTYRAPTLTPIAGDVSLWTRLMHHIYGEYTDMVIDHMAYTVQKPQDKIRWQILVHGKPRTGKTLSIQPLKHIFGNACKTVDAVVDEKFDDVYVGSKVVVFEEIWGDRRNYNHLKSKLANDGMDVLNPKSRAKITQMNRYAMYMFSNHEDALSIDREGDKLLVIKGPDRALEAAFYEQYGAEMLSGYLFNKVYDFLLQRDVSSFSYGRLPIRTQAAIDMAQAAAPESESVIEHAMAHGYEPFGRCHFEDIDLRTDCEPFKTVGVAYETVRLFLSEKRVYGRATSVKSVLIELGFELIRGQKKGYDNTPAIYVEAKYGIGKLRTVEIFDWLCKFYLLTDRQMTQDMRRYGAKMGWTKENLLVEIAKKEQDWSILD